MTSDPSLSTVQLHRAGHAGHHHLRVFPTRRLRLLHKPAGASAAAAAVRVRRSA